MPGNPPPTADWNTLIAGLLAGENHAVETFYAQHAGRLRAIAERQIATVLKRRLDADDVVQSALRSFFRRSQNDQFVVSDGKRFWSLICAIVLTKAREKARFHTRMRRTPARETAAPSEAGPSAQNADSPEDTAAVAEQFELFLNSLEDRERQVVDLKLQDQTHAEIARQIRSSERTVTRLVSKLEQKLAQILQPSER